MSLLSRITDVFRPGRLNREIDEELESHIQEAIEHGRDPAEARRALGSALRLRERSRDIRLVGWIDSIRADAVFGWRQLNKRKATSAAAILSLAIGIGACTSAFRLIDALLLRPLPVTEPGRLCLLSRQGIDWDGRVSSYDGCPYPLFSQLRAAVKDQAELLAVSYSERMDLTYDSDQEMESPRVQYCSGWMFGSFGLRPAAGRLFNQDDDLKPGALAYAVLSYDYWTRRFGRDSSAVGRTFRMGKDLYEIIGVVDRPFTGTEPGVATDIFLPTMMSPEVTRSDVTWLRIFALIPPGQPLEPLRLKLQANSRAFEEDRAKEFVGMPRQNLDNFLNQTELLERAPTGVSDLQSRNRGSLTALAALVALVLLIACANVANLMTAQAAARAREMALRISIGAGRWRLVQLVMVESAWIGLLAVLIGACFAWWSAPFVVSLINPPDNPARLSMPADWRVFGFGAALTLGVTCLFGLAPALRASAVKPVNELKGGRDQHSRRRLMYSLVAAQVAFCFLVQFVAGLFVATFERLSNQPIGFSAERLVNLDTIAEAGASPVLWEQVAEHLRTVPGVERVALADRPLLDGYSWNNFISVNGAPPTEILAYFRAVSPGWVDQMKITLIDGRDFLASDTAPGAAIVNETFARTYFNGENPVGKAFARARDQGEPTRFKIVGLVRNIPYRSLRESILPTAYIPFRAIDANGGFQPRSRATFIVRTSDPNPLRLGSILREEVRRAGTGFRVSRIRTQMEINESHTVRERLLAMLAVFFGIVALLLAGVGLYGVVHYAVLQRSREIGIRIAIGARAARIAGLVTLHPFSMVLAGALAGLLLGLTLSQYIGALFYQVKPTDLAMLALPSLTILLAAVLAALPSVIRAVRIDPVKMLRSD